MSTEIFQGLCNRISTAKAAAAFIMPIPKKLEKAISAFFERDFETCLKTSHADFSELVWIPVASIVASAAETMIQITPKAENAVVVQIKGEKS